MQNNERNYEKAESEETKKTQKNKTKQKEKQKRICKRSFIYDIRKKSINFVDVLNWHSTYQPNPPSPPNHPGKIRIFFRNF